MVKDITDENFKKEVIDSGNLVLIDFWAEWCGPCRSFAPIFDEVAAEMKDTVTFYKMNIEISPNTPSQLGVRTIPTLILFKDGKQLDLKVGSQSKESLIEWLNDAL